MCCVMHSHGIHHWHIIILMKYRVYSSKYEAKKAVAVPGIVGMEECSLDLFCY